jgi:hypothetical protein
MRMKIGKLLTFFLICINFVLVYYSWKYFLSSNEFGHQTFSAASIAGRLANEPDLDIANSQIITGDDGEEAFEEPTKKTTKRDKSEFKVLRNREKIQATNRQIRKSLTVIFRDFYDFDNDLKQSITSLTNLVPNLRIFVIYNNIPYPPLDLFDGQGSNNSNVMRNVKFFSLNYDVNKSLKDTIPSLQVKTKYVLFMPDSARFSGRGLLQRAIKEINTPNEQEIMLLQNEHILLKQNNRVVDKSKRIIDYHNQRTMKKIIAIPFASNSKAVNNCCRLDLDLPNWTLEYTFTNETDNCDMVRDRQHTICYWVRLNVLIAF